MNTTATITAEAITAKIQDLTEIGEFQASQAMDRFTTEGPRSDGAALYSGMSALYLSAARQLRAVRDHSGPMTASRIGEIAEEMQEAADAFRAELLADTTGEGVAVSWSQGMEIACGNVAGHLRELLLP